MSDPARITLTRKQLLWAAALFGLGIGTGSPLRELIRPGDAPPELTLDDRTALGLAGWLVPGGRPQLTPAATQILQTLVCPATHIRLVLGTRDLLGTVDAYAASGLYSEGLISFSVDGPQEQYRIQTGLSPSELVESLTAQVLNGPLEDSVSFHVSLNSYEFVTLLAVLDWWLHDRFKAVLDRAPAIETRFPASDLREMLVRGTSGRDLGWTVTILAQLFPFFDFDLDEKEIAIGLAGLQTGELVSAAREGGYSPAPALENLIRLLLPVVNYGALHLEQWNNEAPLPATHLAFLRGPQTVLLVQPVVDERGLTIVAVDGVDAVQLADILFDLGMPNLSLILAIKRATAIEEPAACPKCGAQLRPGRRFCGRCGAALEPTEARKSHAPAPPPVQSVCPTCKAEVKPGRKFCTACGSPLAATVEKAEAR